MAGKVTLQQIAEAAHVSAATVSRVANGNAQVEPKIQARVRAAARQLGIEITANNKNRNIAFLLGNRNGLNEFQSQVLMGAEEYCSRQRWDLQFISHVSDGSMLPSSPQLPRALSRQDRVRGVILTGTHSAEMLSLLQEQRVAFAVMGNNVVGEWDHGAYDSVATDAVSGSTEITEYLIALGHHRIHFIGDQRLPWYAQCAEGYRRSMRAARLEVSFSDIRSDERELGYLAAKSMLQKQRETTAVFAGNDQAAAGVYAALQESGVRIPDEMTVVGFNDTIASVLHPALTTVREFPKEQGRHLAELVLQRILEPTISPHHVLMPTELIRRDSAAPPKKTRK